MRTLLVSFNRASIHAMPSFSRLGAIEDIQNDLYWPAETLAREISVRAAELGRLGIRRKSRVAIAQAGSAHFFADLCAVWRLGATALCLDPELTASELANVIAFAKPDLVLVWRKQVAAAGAPVLDLSRARGPEQRGNGLTDAQDAALVLFTSGTTGEPKGVELSFGALAARLAANGAIIEDRALARSLLTLPTHFGHGLIGNALTPLLAGGTLVLPPLGLALAKDLGRIIDAHRISFMSSVPAMWKMALKLSGPPRADSLCRVHVGSAPLLVRLWEDIGKWARCKTVNCYGMTETANWFAGASSEEGIEEGLVGRPWEGSVRVRCEDRAAASGEGEILVRSAGIMSGYLDRPDLTAAVLQDGWYRTGDYGRVENGRIWLTGRIKDEINRAGFKVHPAEIDRLLESHPAVAAACTFGLPDPVGGESVAVAVQLNEGFAIGPDRLRAWCLERVRREAVPEHWRLVDEIPRTGRGKLNRQAVRRQLFPETAR
jgi:oxalate---CoA ligase